MDVLQFMKLAKQFASLGDATGDQMLAVADGHDPADQNINALFAGLPLLRRLEWEGLTGVSDLIETILEQHRVSQLPVQPCS